VNFGVPFLQPFFVLLHFLFELQLSAVDLNGSITVKALRMIFEVVEQFHGSLGILDAGVGSVLYVKAQCFLDDVLEFLGLTMLVTFEPVVGGVNVPHVVQAERLDIVDDAVSHKHHFLVGSSLKVADEAVDVVSDRFEARGSSQHCLVDSVDFLQGTALHIEFSLLANHSFELKIDLLAGLRINFVAGFGLSFFRWRAKVAVQLLERMRSFHSNSLSVLKYVLWVIQDTGVLLAVKPHDLPFLSSLLEALA